MGWGGGLLGLLLLSFFPGCRSDSGAPAWTVVELWALGREGELVERMLPEFERSHPELRVRLQQIPWSAAHEKLLTAYVGEAMPDVFQIGNTWVPEFVALGALESLDARISASAVVSLEDYFPGLVDANVIDGSLWALPWYADTRLVFYRKDLLAEAGVTEPPRTWNAWIEVMTRVRQRATAGTFAILAPLNEWQLPVILALQRGVDLLRENGTHGNFLSPPFREAFGFYVELFQRGLAPRTAEAQIANLYQEFARGTFTFYVSGPWNIGEFSRRLPAALRDQWATAPMPSPDEEYPGVSLGGGASLAVHRHSVRKDAAWRLVEYLSSPERQVELYRLGGDLPPGRVAWTEGGLQRDPRVQAFWQQLQRIRPTPKIPEWEQIADRIGRYAESAIRGRMTIDEALGALDADVDRLLEKRRWLMARRGREA